MAGVIGCDPEPLTLRRLHFRYLGRVTAAWDHTSALQATVYSVAGGKIVNPITLHPYRGRRSRPPVTRREAKQTASDLRLMIRARKR